MKDKLPSSSHEEREAQRRKRAQEEQEAYQRHLHIRRQMSKAMETGEPQLLGKDRNGKDVYIEPPQMPRGYPGYGGGGRIRMVDLMEEGMVVDSGCLWLVVWLVVLCWVGCYSRVWWDLKMVLRSM